jgi:hypothetical protein
MAAPTGPADTPDLHGFVMSGLETLFLSHLPMFAMPNHQYQVVLRVTIPAAAMRTTSPTGSRTRQCRTSSATSRPA